MFSRSYGKWKRCKRYFTIKWTNEFVRFARKWFVQKVEEGTGQKELQIGLNTFEILVESANGLEQIYTINITRSTEEIPGPVISSKLKLLTVNGLVLNVSEENQLFLYGISNDINTLNINPVTESTTATVQITGNENLKVGTNRIDIKVTQILEEAIPPTEEDEGKEAVVEETTYTLIVYKNPNNASEIDSLDKIDGTNNYVFTTSRCRISSATRKCGFRRL